MFASRKLFTIIFTVTTMVASHQLVAMERQPHLNNNDRYLVAELHRACWNNNLDLVQTILGKASSKFRVISSRGQYGQTALHIAVSIGSLQIVTYLLNVAAQANKLQSYLAMRNLNGKTASNLASKSDAFYIQNDTPLVSLMDYYSSNW